MTSQRAWCHFRSHLLIILILFFTLSRVKWMLEIMTLEIFFPFRVSLKLSDMRTVLESLSPVMIRRPLEPDK